MRMMRPEKKELIAIHPAKPVDKAPPTSNIWDNHSVSSVFCYAALVNTTTGTFYTDTNVSFPVTSLKNIQAYFVAYDYERNTIFAKPCPEDLKDHSIWGGIQQVEGQRQHTCVQMTNKQTTVPFNAFLNKKDASGKLYTHQTITSTWQNKPSTPSGTVSSVAFPQPIDICPWNFGTTCQRKQC